MFVLTQLQSIVLGILKLNSSCGTAQFKLYTHVWVHACMCMLKVYNVECIFFVACGFVMRTRAVKQSWHTRLAPHEETRHECTFS